MPKPLAGLRVVDFSHVMAGPFATHFLTLLGAEVIKVESPSGDIFRGYDADPRYAAMSPAFIAANAGKKSIVLDLKSERGMEAARRLVATSDVLVENFRPGVLAKLGLGYEAARALRDDIIYCSVSGYGQGGPMRDYPAIDVSMLDASLVLLTSAVTPFLVKGEVPVRTGNTGYSAQPTAGMFRCSDGELISLGVVQQNQYQKLCAAIDRPDLATDPRFVDIRSRRAHAQPLTAILTGVFTTQPAGAWEAKLSVLGIPCGAVRDVGAAAMLPQLDGRGLKQPVRIEGLPEGEDVHVLNAGFVFAHDGPGVDAPPPKLGEHTDAILAELGLAG